MQPDAIVNMARDHAILK